MNATFALRCSADEHIGNRVMLPIFGGYHSIQFKLTTAAYEDVGEIDMKMDCANEDGG